MYFPIRPSLSLWIGVAAIAASIAAVYLHFREVGQLRERLEVVIAERDNAISRMARAQLAVSACMAVNLENAQAREAEAERAKDAEVEILRANQAANDAILAIQVRIARLRERNLDCPAIDADFREWMQDSP